VALIDSPNEDDASWAAVPGLANSSAASFASLSKNSSFAGLYLSQVSTLSGNCANRWKAPAGDVVVAAAGAAGVTEQTWAVSAPPPLPPASPATLSIATASVDHVVSPRFFGCHVDPGYTKEPMSWTASLVFGNAFEREGNNDGAVYQWNNVSSPAASGAAALDGSVIMNPAANLPTLKVTFSSGSGYVGQSNRGVGNEGLAWLAGREYPGVAFVFAPTGATLYAGMHDRDQATVDASVSVTVPASSEWQKVNFTFVPSADAGCTGIPWGSDPSLDCRSGGSNPGHICVRCAGEFVVGLGAPGTAWIGWADVRLGEWGTFAGVAQRSTVELMQSIGITAIRQGGTVSQTFAWKDWRGPPHMRAANGHYWAGRLIPVTWGLFDFVDMANAAGIHPVVTLAYDLNSADDWADLVEYAWGNESTPWGAVRIFNDSHPAPYDMYVTELGNEQGNPDFAAQVAAMEARSAAIGSPAWYYMYPQNGAIAPALQQQLLQIGGQAIVHRIMPDIHVGATGGVGVAEADAVEQGNFTSSFINAEVNAATSTMVRAITEAEDLQTWVSVNASFAARLHARTASFCTERSGNFGEC
jgi:hypothetical protein